jgi:transcriptional regulator of arginine metabolism
VSDVPRTTSNDRAKRRQRLIEYLRDGLAATQDDIVKRLASEGFHATQATVSRDLDDIGAVRRHEGGRITYALTERNGPPVGFGQRVIGELVRSVASSGNLVVVRTFPGMAPTVGAVLDQSDIAGVLGTVAGDDTVIVVAEEKIGGAKLAERISALGEAS